MYLAALAAFKKLFPKLVIPGVILLFLSVAFLYQRSHYISLGEERATVRLSALYAESFKAADNEKRDLEKLYAQAVKDSNDAKQKALQRIASEAAASQSILSRMQQQLAARSRDTSADSSCTQSKYYQTLSDVLSSCTAALVEMGERADGHTEDALMLYNSWPGMSKEK
jgi:hypothetical protein